MMMSARRQSGAVNILFLIMTIVIAIIGWALWYVQLSKNTDLINAKATAETQRDDALDKEVKLKGAFERLAKVCGGVTGTLPEPKPQTEETIEDYYENQIEPMLAGIRQRLTEYRTLFGGDESTVQTLFDLPRPAEALLTKKDTKISETTNALTSARQEKTTAEEANVQLVAQHGTEIDAKNAEIAQNRERAASQLQAQEDEYKRAAAERDQINEKYEKTIQENRKALQALRDKTAALEREVRDFKAPLRIKRMREEPDGHVVAADNRAGECWIDVGSRKLLRRGTRFRAFGVRKGGERVPHGYIVVHDIEKDRARCSIESGTIAEGDLITNPYFDPDGPKIFFFLGKLPGRFNNQTAKSILEDFGAVVTDKFSIHVDFLVLGDNPDPEAGVGPDADPNWFKATEAYGDALRWGVEMIRARDLETYLQY